jgi:hypothetical protein
MEGAMAIADRMIRAAKGDKGVFEEVEQDGSATTEAMLVVGLVALAGGIGSAIGQAFAGRPSNLVFGIVIGIAGALIGWAVFSGITYFIGSRLFGADATWEEVLRTLGYAYSPMIVQILVWIPILGGLLLLVAALWTLYLDFVAIRSALDIDNGKTIATILLAIIPSLIIIAIINAPLAAMSMR